MKFSVRDTIPGEILPKRATQGSNYTDEKGTHEAHYSIDQLLTTRSATHTNDGAGWLKLELERTYFVQKVMIYLEYYQDWPIPGDTCRESPENFKTHCLDPHTGAEVRVEEQGQSVLCAALNLRSGLRRSDQIYPFVCNKFGDAVVLLKREGILSVSEVVIITPQGNSLSFFYIPA